MIISVHIPKTAGRSFQQSLQAQYGERLLADYGDWLEIHTPQAQSHNQGRREQAIAALDGITSGYDVIHGHFKATKYVGVFPVTDLLCFVRDPYQHALSAHAQGRRLAEAAPWSGADPSVERFRSRGMSLFEMVEAFPNLQSYFVDNVSLEDFALIGLTDQYERSLALFARVFGVALREAAQQVNANPDQAAPSYDISAEVRRFIDSRQGQDVELYRMANERFERLARQYGL